MAFKVLKVLPVLGLALLLVALTANRSRGQTPAPTTGASVDTTAEAGEPVPKRRMVKWNEYDGPISSFRFGFGFLVDMVTYSQDDKSKQQVSPEPDAGLRDFRLLFRGRFKTKRPFSWCVGYMYDGSDDTWHFRKTGLQLGVPELSGQFFVGRDKEGYSLNKIMVGYDGWTMERYTASDAFIPILADGVKYMGFAPKPRLLWNAGLFTDVVSHNEGYSAYDHLFVARLGWLPVLSDSAGKVAHIALMVRDGKPEDGMIRQKSKPENFLAPLYLDTGTFEASNALTMGIEAYYRKGPWLMGTEYNFQQISSDVGGDPLFHGGDVSLAWTITGETRPYNPATGSFRAISPKRTVFEGGPGAWEAVLRFSYTDLDAGTIHGGKFWRITPMVNWHLSDNFRLEFVYGYGVLDRFDLQGGTQFFQTRLQTSL
jgi:phosphate-selective porin OprO/OprP